MALVLLKSMVFPTTQDRKDGKYRPVRASSPSNDGSDVEREARPSSTFSESFADEKQLHRTTNDNKVCRINPRMISDATIGLSDGLTVPFALTAGLSALGNTHIVVYAGLAELIAGGISMGLGGYLGAKSEAEAYSASLAETKTIVMNDHEKAARLVRATFDSYDFPGEVLAAMTTSLLREPNQMVDFLMRFHHQLTEADYAPSRAYVSGLTISAGYIMGGLVALLPYLFLGSIHQAFVGSVVVMAVALFAFGWAKTALVGESDRWVCFKNGAQMLVLGSVAAGAAMGCVKVIGE